MSFEIAPVRALRYARDLSSAVAPPYDIISPEEHRSLLERSPWNVVRLTLGDQPGKRAHYRERADLLETWRVRNVLHEDPEPALYVYGVEYTGAAARRLSFRGLAALGSLHDFQEGVVRPHERTFADVVDDRYRLLEATRTHLEMILLLYLDPERRIDAHLNEAARGVPEMEVEARPGETHALWAIRDGATIERLKELFRNQRPIIADGHHRYTTACLYRKEAQGDPSRRAGAAWMPMVLGNLFGEGLSILATHRLLSLGGRSEEALRVLEEKLVPVRGEAPAELEVETREAARRFSIPAGIRSARRGAAATDYAILHDLVLEEWLKHLLRGGSGRESESVRYFREGTGEREALRRGEGDLLFRMRPVGREEFRKVVEGGDVFPHKTTFFYPKIWSGLVLWKMAEPELS